MGNKPSVLLIDDVALVAETIAAVLHKTFDYSVDTAFSIDEALEKIAAVGSYCAILLDFNMPGIRTFDALKRLNHKNGGRTAIFSGVADPDIIADAKLAGAVAFIPKDTPISTLGTAIGDIAAGKIGPFPTVVSARAAQGEPGPVLRARERRMLALSAEGLDLESVATALAIPPAIVGIDIRSVCQKLSAANLDDAISKARTLGLI